MLGAVKDDGGEAQVPLFRVLARKWTSLAPVKGERSALSSMSPAEDKPKAPRVWIAKPRQIYAHQKIEQPKSVRGWNPWLWVR